MRTLSATEAIAPAWAHTRALLLRPLRWRTLFKVCAVAFLAQLGGFSFNFSNFSSRSSHRHMPAMPAAAVALLVGIVIAAVLAALVFSLVIFYIGSRCEFVLFDIVLRRDTAVGPIWARFGAATWRWMGLKLLFFLVALLCIAPIAVPFVLSFGRVVSAMPAGPATPAEFAALFTTLLGFIAAVFLVALVLGLVYVLLRDFGLPSMAMEGTPVRETAARVLRLCRAEPGQVLLYLLLRFCLAFAGAAASELLIVFGMLLALAPLGALGYLLWAGLHTAGAAGWAGIVLGWCLLGLVLLALVLLAAVPLFGGLFCFLQAYALYFLGGRYPLVGQYLGPFVRQLLYIPPTVPPAGYPPIPAPTPPGQ